MKRKLIMMILSVALTLSLIPTLSAYADDELNQGGTPDTTGQVQEDMQGDEDVPDSDIEDEDAIGDEDVVEEESDLDEGETVEVDLPKINIKSPVTQWTQSDIGTQYTLVAKVGEETIAPALVTWTSDNKSIATVSAEGVVTIVGVGKVNFTAVMTDGTARNGYAKAFVFADTSITEVKSHSDAIADTESLTPEENNGKKTHK